MYRGYIQGNAYLLPPTIYPKGTSNILPTHKACLAGRWGWIDDNYVPTQTKIFSVLFFGR